MIKPRNSLVVVRLIEKAEQKVGKITVPSNDDLYGEGEILAVGPGTISAEGGVSETFDLKIGQRVMVKHKSNDPRSGGKIVAGIRYMDGEEILYIFEQASIVGILAEPGDMLASTPATKYAPSHGGYSD